MGGMQVKVLALYSIKGGVGKSTASVNLAYEASQNGLKTLVIDLDPLGASTYCFRVTPPKKLDSSTLIEGGKKLRKFIRETDFPRLDILPSTFDYRTIDLLFDEEKHPKRLLQIVLKSNIGEYDLVVIDCTPNLTLLSENVLRAADLIAVPVIPTPLSLNAYEKLRKQTEGNKIKSGTIRPFISMLDRRKKIQIETTEMLIKKKRTFQAIIPFTSHIEKMTYYRDPVQVSAQRSRGAEAYRLLWKEIWSQLQTEKK